MSSNNNTTSLVPILNGTNYVQWAVAMKAFLCSQGLWAYAKGDMHREEFPDKKEDRDAMIVTKKQEIHAT